MLPKKRHRAKSHPIDRLASDESRAVRRARLLGLCAAFLESTLIKVDMRMRQDRTLVLHATAREQYETAKSLSSQIRKELGVTRAEMADSD